MLSRVHETRLQTRWTDFDALGHITHAAYPMYLDEGRDAVLTAKVGPFMALMVTDCYDDKDQKIFRDGLDSLDDASKKANGKSFMDSTPAQRTSLLESLDREQKNYMDHKKPDDRSHWFRMVKELALLGYFTSEIGYTQAMRYREAPGHFDPCVDYKPGEKSWAPHA